LYGSKLRVKTTTAGHSKTLEKKTDSAKRKRYQDIIQCHLSVSRTLERLEALLDLVDCALTPFSTRTSSPGATDMVHQWNGMLCRPDLVQFLAWLLRTRSFDMPDCFCFLSKYTIILPGCSNTRRRDFARERGRAFIRRRQCRTVRSRCAYSYGHKSAVHAEHLISRAEAF
jgi:hypothetical protein